MEEEATYDGEEETTYREEEIGDNETYEHTHDSETLEHTHEVYHISHDKTRNLIIYGGNDQACTIFNMKEGHPEALIEGFSDSVVFCRYLDSDLILVCTMDGTISLLTREDIIQSEKIEEDITYVDVVGDKILIGGSLGSVYVFTSDLSSHNVYLGHSSDIHKIYYSDNTVYALSDNQFIAFNETTFQQKYRKNLRGATVFEPIPHTDIFCVGKEGEVIILKNGFLLNKFEVQGTPECILYSYDHFIIGGSFPYLVLLNTKMNMREYRLRLDIEGTTKLQAIGKSQIAMSTMCGQVGVGDIRKDDSFDFRPSEVGSVFDFQYVEGKFYAGGVHGFEVVEESPSIKEIN